MIANLINIATRTRKSIHFQKHRDTIEKRFGRWLKDLTRQSQTVGFDLNAWIPGSNWSAILALGVFPRLHRQNICMTETLTLSQLSSSLWKAAWHLKGPVDAADFKTYIFPLLFFKRLSDVHDEEHEAAPKKFDGDEEAALFPENYRFQVPAEAHWREIRTGYDHHFPSQSL